MMKNAFHFTLKALFALKIFKSLFELFGYLEKRLDEKDKAKNVKMYIISKITILKFVTLQPGKQIIVICILSNISRNEGIQKMKFVQLIEYNKKYFCLKNHLQNVVKKLFSHILIVCQVEGY